MISGLDASSVKVFAFKSLGAVAVSQVRLILLINLALPLRREPDHLLLQNLLANQTHRRQNEFSSNFLR